MFGRLRGSVTFEKQGVSGGRPARREGSEGGRKVYTRLGKGRWSESRGPSGRQGRVPFDGIHVETGVGTLVGTGVTATLKSHYGL